jgi:hypothetical protein
MRLWLSRTLIVVLGTLVFAPAAAAQVEPANGVASMPDDSVRPRVTVRFHVGPNLNIMRDWRDGLDLLEGLAQQRGLPIRDESCICMSWGTTALAHVTNQLAIGGEFEVLRDTRKFSVDDQLRAFGINETASFAFRNETVVQTSQAVAAFYPRQNSHLHFQIGAGVGRGHTEFNTPGSYASGRVRGWLLTTSVGTEARFWYVDAGWRFHRTRTTLTEIGDHTIDEARDVFSSEADVRDFLNGREADLTGGWVRVGLAFRFGRR